MDRILILGATSAIAEATARIFASRGHALFLVARRAGALAAIADDLKVRGAARIETQVLDLNRNESHVEMLSRAIGVFGGLDLVLIAHGTLLDQDACQRSVELTLQEFNTNALSVISLLTLLANYFEEQRQGTIAVITSVAGDRGRGSNYVYGSAKACVTTFLSGLRQRLHSKGVRVLTIKPGYVDSPMTAHFKKGLLWVGPETVAHGIVRALDKKKDTVYLPPFWRIIMGLVNMVPERCFRSLKI